MRETIFEWKGLLSTMFKGALALELKAFLMLRLVNRLKNICYMVLTLV